jgi:hypothetical protein
MPSPLQQFKRVYTLPDFGKTTASAGKLVSTTDFTEIGRLTVPAGQQIAWGSGNTNSGVDERGTIKLRCDDTNGVQFHGTFWIAVANPSLTVIRVIMEDRSENLDDGVKLAESKIRAGTDRHLLIFMKGDVASTVSYTDADTQGSLLPATVYQ